jgi:hypothetical protein
MAGGESRKFSGTVSSAWTLRGRYLEQTGTYNLGATTPPLIIKTLMTFEVKDNRYQYWYFLSDGQKFQTTGQWDQALRTMTSKGSLPGNGNTLIITAKFDENGTESWTIETRNRDNQVVGRMRGINSRRKQP